MNTKNTLTVWAIVISSLMLAVVTPVFAEESEETTIERGRYIVEIGGCNDCHTLGFPENGGTSPEDSRLRGSPLGFSGPWGTTYPANLRQYFSLITQDEWLQTAKTLRTKPPMPWWSVNAMTEKDSKAVYAYITSLGATDDAVPAYLPPGQKPTQPYIQWPLQADQ